MRKPIVVIVGPTASGKSALALSLAEKLDGEIVSADSMQIYKRMNIGTAKPTKEEMSRVRHHMIDVVEPTANYSVGEYVSDAKKAVDGILARGKLPVLVGGTGLYVDTFINGTRLGDAGADEKLRQELTETAAQIGGAEMKKILAEFDPESAARLHDNDIKRIVRAIEVYRLTGKSQTQWNNESMSAPSEYEPIYFGLNAEDRQFLYSRINMRVDMMREDGLYEEVKELIESGVPDNCTAMQAIGYKEMALAVRGDISVEQACEDIKQATRRYAKRQLTWFGRNKKINWFFIDKDEKQEILLKAHNSTKSAFSL